MKRLIKLLFALAFVPLLLLSGCGNTKSSLETQQLANEYTAPKFYFDVNNRISSYQSLSSKYQYNTTDNIKSILTNDVWGNVTSVNKQFMFIMTVYDMKLEDKKIWFYDLSNLDKNLSNAKIEAIKDSTSEYRLMLSGNETNLMLPQSMVNNDGYIAGKDSMDEYITQWGNSIKFSVDYITANKSFQIKAISEFVYPPESQVPASEDGDVKVYREDNRGTITLVYTDSTNNIVSKEITFSKDQTGNSTKKVKFYNGDKKTDLTLLPTYTYEYTTTSSKLLGTYEIYVDKKVGYFQGKHIIGGGESNTIEFYLLKSNYVMAEYDIVKSASTITNQILISSDASTSTIKYKNHNENINTIKDFATLDKNNFARITTSDKQSKNKVIQYNLAYGKINYESIGY